MYDYIILYVHWSNKISPLFFLGGRGGRTVCEEKKKPKTISASIAWDPEGKSFLLELQKFSVLFGVPAFSTSYLQNI